MMRRRTGLGRTRGFTLVELSIVVVAVGVLAAIAVVVFIRFRRSARMSEATNMVSMIKSEQEAYRNEKGLYAPVSDGSDSYYPATNPGAFTTAWGAPCTNCIEPNAWGKLHVKPSQPVMYGYSAVAGVGADIGRDVGSRVSGPSLPDRPTSGPCTSIGETQPYYVIQAKGDTDGDGVASAVLALSCMDGLVLTNQGE